MTEVQIISKPFYKKVLKFFLWLFISFIIIISLGIALIVIYEDDIKATIIKELNKNLNAEVRIKPEDIDVTLISTFPNCSLLFKNVLMLDATNSKQKDTLIFAQELNLFFNAKDIYDKKYSITKIKLNNSKVNIKEYKNGANNYIFWKANTNKTNNDSLSFKLDDITILNCEFYYSNQISRIKSNLKFNEINFSGLFGSTDYELTTTGNFELKQLTKNKKNILKNKHCVATINLIVSNSDYKIKNALFSLNQMKFKCNGNFIYKDSLQFANIDYQGTDLDIESILSLIPQTKKDRINDYKSSGTFYIKGQYHFAEKNNYFNSTKFGIQKSSVIYMPKNIEMKDVNLEGELTLTPKINNLKLNNINANLLGDRLSGNFELSDFEMPYIKSKLNAKINLENIISFWPVDTVKNLKGLIDIDTEIEGSLENIKNNIASNAVKLKLNADVKNLKLLFKNSNDTFSINTCSLLVVDRDISIKNLAFNKGKSDLLINGKMPKLFNYITTNNTPLVIEGDLYSNKIYLSDFINESEQTAETTTIQLIPNNVDFKLTSTIKNFYYKKFEATNISGELGIKNRKAILTDLKFNTLQGDASVDVFADNTTQNIDVVLQSNFKSINAQQLFTVFENFGQSTLKDKNIKGYITSTLNFKATFRPTLVVEEKTIEANADLLIERGELIDFKPLLSLSKFVDINELQRIKFSTLQSTINIQNSTISFPKTEINNSALNIIASGTHNFNNEINYHLQLRISELLAKKNKPNNEFGPIENDKENKRCAFVLMTGTVDNPIIKYDRKGLKEKIKNDIKDEKQNLKNILKEEFNLFKKDSVKKATDKSNQPFELEKPNNKNTKKTFEPKKEKADDDDF